MPGLPDKPPSRFDANLIVIGAGSAGLVTAYVAAAARARVLLIERDRMGGDCLNTGCVPSKALIQTARVAAQIERAAEFGLVAGPLGVDFPRVMQRVRQVIARVAPHDSVERYTALGVECLQGRARLLSPWSVEVNGQTLTGRGIVLATGGRPLVPAIPGLDRLPYLTSETIWQLEALPRRLLVLGGGPLGCELAQAFRRLGSEVTLVEMAPRLLAREDPEASAAVAARLSAEGVQVLTGNSAEAFESDGGRHSLLCEDAQGRRRIDFDQLLVATGRRANTDGLELHRAGLALREDGTVPVNACLQTAQPQIFACGDVTGPFQLTHAAGYQGWICAMNALFMPFKRFRADYSVMPRGIFTDPEIARVGLTAAEAESAGIAHDVTRYGIDELDRAIADGDAHGFVKVVTRRGSDRILGATVVGPHAAELITEYVTAMKYGMGLRKILNTIHIYPTLSEANRFAAGSWQQARLSPLLLKAAATFHRWRRG